MMSPSTSLKHTLSQDMRAKLERRMLEILRTRKKPGASC
jgi:hypothetical protein